MFKIVKFKFDREYFYDDDEIFVKCDINDFEEIRKNLDALYVTAKMQNYVYDLENKLGLQIPQFKIFFTNEKKYCQVLITFYLDKDLIINDLSIKLCYEENSYGETESKEEEEFNNSIESIPERIRHIIKFLK